MSGRCCSTGQPEFAVSILHWQNPVAKNRLVLVDAAGATLDTGRDL
jgi:hypothetical protein